MIKDNSPKCAYVEIQDGNRTVYIDWSTPELILESWENEQDNHQHWLPSPNKTIRQLLNSEGSNPNLDQQIGSEAIWRAAQLQLAGWEFHSVELGKLVFLRDASPWQLEQKELAEVDLFSGTVSVNR